MVFSRPGVLCELKMLECMLKRQYIPPATLIWAFKIAPVGIFEFFILESHPRLNWHLPFDKFLRTSLDQQTTQEYYRILFVSVSIFFKRSLLLLFLIILICHSNVKFKWDIASKIKNLINRILQKKPFCRKVFRNKHICLILQGCQKGIHSDGKLYFLLWFSFCLSCSIPVSHDKNHPGYRRTFRNFIPSLST